MRWTEEKDREIKALVKKGLTYREVGELVGVSKRAIANRIYRLKIDKPKHVWINNDKNSKINKQSDYKQREQDFDGVPLDGLKNSQCHYTVNAKDFCGDDVKGKSPYCERHYKICYTKPKQLTPKGDKYG